MERPKKPKSPNQKSEGPKAASSITQLTMQEYLFRRDQLENKISKVIDETRLPPYDIANAIRRVLAGFEFQGMCHSARRADMEMVNEMLSRFSDAVKDRKVMKVKGPVPPFLRKTLHDKT